MFSQAKGIEIMGFILGWSISHGFGHLISAPILKNGRMPENKKKRSIDRPTNNVVAVCASRYSFRCSGGLSLVIL